MQVSPNLRPSTNLPRHSSTGGSHSIKRLALRNSLNSASLAIFDPLPTHLSLKPPSEGCAPDRNCEGHPRRAHRGLRASAPPAHCSCQQPSITTPTPVRDLLGFLSRALALWRVRHCRCPPTRPLSGRHFAAQEWVLQRQHGPGAGNVGELMVTPFAGSLAAA